MQKKLVLLGLVLLSVLGISASALELDSAELRRALQSTDLEFINYQGPYDVINTIEQIRGIGRFLGGEITSTPDATSANYFGKYRVLRVLDTNAPDKLSADLYLIEANAEVDSITNIRRMLSGYLMDTFSSSADDAELLAKLITIYNAIYRGDMNNVNTYYVSAVADQVSEDNVGLARVYSQWAGKTRMLIPLRASVDGGPASLVDVNALTTDQVMRTLIASEANPATAVQQVADQKDATNEAEQKNVTDLVDMLSVREAELAEQEKALQAELEMAQRGEGTRTVAEIERDLMQVKAQQEELARQKEEAQASQEQLNADEAKADAGREQAQGLIQESQAPVAEAQQPTTGNEAGANATIAPADNAQATAPAEGEQANAEASPATEPAPQAETLPATTPAPADNNATTPANNNTGNQAQAGTQQPAAAQPGQAEPAVITPAEEASSEVVAQVGNLVYFTRIIDGPKGVGQALLVDSSNKQILAQSADLNVMRGSSFLRGDELIVVTLEKDGARLKALDAKTLVEKSQALYLVHARSTMNANDEAIYLVVEKDNNWYLARFGRELTVGEVLSEDAVMPYTEIRFQEGAIYVESATGDILTLDPATLKQK